MVTVDMRALLAIAAVAASTFIAMHPFHYSGAAASKRGTPRQ
jgi:hypothetical protein